MTFSFKAMSFTRFDQALGRIGQIWWSHAWEQGQIVWAEAGTNFLGYDETGTLERESAVLMMYEDGLWVLPIAMVDIMASPRPMYLGCRVSQTTRERVPSS